MIYRDLEKVRGIIEDATSLEVSYAYDDLVFPDHTAFIIQFDDTKTTRFFCYFHKDCNLKDKKELEEKLKSASLKQKCDLIVKGDFYLEQENEQVNIHFL
ncbi:hypothetical protein [Thalassobellus citreus]|uniref:hypothetical protein n=1 Tax=Thalassobellus citreus TaxID=3367752 RepID=UPI0037956A0C